MKKVGRNALLSIYFHIFVIYSINKTKVDNSVILLVCAEESNDRFGLNKTKTHQFNS